MMNFLNLIQLPIRLNIHLTLNTEIISTRNALETIQRTSTDLLIQSKFRALIYISFGNVKWIGCNFARCHTYMGHSKSHLLVNIRYTYIRSIRSCLLFVYLFVLLNPIPILSSQFARIYGESASNFIFNE